MTSYLFRVFVLGTIFPLLSTIIHAGEIRLQSTNGAFSLSGELVEFDGEAYILKSVFGQVRIDANAVVCSGEACPDLSAYANVFTVSASYSVGKNLLPISVKEFAIMSEYQISLTDGAGLDLVDDDGDIAAHINLDNGDSNSEFSDLAEGNAMLVISSQHPSASEIAAINDAGFGDITSAGQRTVLAMDALVILVSNDNPVNSLNMLQIGKIFSGKITNWNEVGGQDAQINVYLQNVATGDSDFFTSVLLSQTGGTFAQTASIISNNGDLQETGEWSFENAAHLLLFCNGPWCGQSPSAINNLLALGYPAARLYYYRGCMQSWASMELSVVIPG